MAAEFEAEFYAGQHNVQMVDWTPTGTIAAGEVVVVGETPYVAHRAMAAAQVPPGALAARGGAYKCRKATDEDMSSGGGKALYFDESENEFTLTATGNKHFGTVWPDGAATADEYVIADHAPNGGDSDVS